MSVMESRDLEHRIFETEIEHGARETKRSRGEQTRREIFSRRPLLFQCVSLFFCPSLRIHDDTLFFLLSLCWVQSRCWKK